MKSSDESLLSTVPLIRRARGYRLYTGDGRRYLDCWQDDGGTILGHRAGAYRQAFLNKAARGLLLRIPGPEHRTLEKAVRALWKSWTGLDSRARRGEAVGTGAGDREGAHQAETRRTEGLREDTRPVYFFRNRERMYSAIADAVGAVSRLDPLAAPVAPVAAADVAPGEALTQGEVPGSVPSADVAPGEAPPQGKAAALGELAGSAGRLVVARPFLPVSAGQSDWIEPVLPLPGAVAPAVLLGPVGDSVDTPTTLCLEGDHIPAGMLAALTRAVYDLLRVQRAGVHPGADFAGELAETGVWRVYGPWLVPSIGGAKSRYRRLFELHLAEGVLINPEAGGTSIVPAESSAGERAWMRTAALRAREEGLVQ